MLIKIQYPINQSITHSFIQSFIKKAKQKKTIKKPTHRFDCGIGWTKIKKKKKSLNLFINTKQFTFNSISERRKKLTTNNIYNNNFTTSTSFVDSIFGLKKKQKTKKHRERKNGAISTEIRGGNKILRLSWVTHAKCAPHCDDILSHSVLCAEKSPLHCYECYSLDSTKPGEEPRPGTSN